jgi:hypothetical protein
MIIIIGATYNQIVIITHRTGSYSTYNKIQQDHCHHTYNKIIGIIGASLTFTPSSL